MLDRDIKSACETSEMICIGLRNDPADDYLIGYVECCDEEGIIFCNVDYQGMKTGYIYMTNDKVTGVMYKPDYIQKLKILMNNKKQKYKKIFGSADIKETPVKEYFLRWIFTNKKMILVRDKDEEFKGILESISEETVSIKVNDKITEKRNGYTVLLRSHIDYFSV